MIASAASTAFVAFQFAATLGDHDHDFGPVWYELRFFALIIKSVFFLTYCVLVGYVWSSFAYMAYHAIGAQLQF